MPDFLDDYVHDSLIGEGYFCLVQRYQHKVTGDMVAVKLLKETFKENADYRHRFSREIQILEQLQGSEHVVELLGSGEMKGRPYYVMPAAQSNLQEFVERNNTAGLDVRDRLELFDSVLDSIIFAHSLGILHRDLAPKNVLLYTTPDGIRLNVADFGLGKNLDADSGYTRSAISNYGQMYYVAPEQIANLNAATLRSDVFSLGRLLDFLLTGRLPSQVHDTAFRSVIEKATRSPILKRALGMRRNFVLHTNG
jgi:serine/threonine protein kinase